MPKDRHGVYVLETDRGELHPTTNTQIALGSIVSKPANHLQDDVRTTMKETTHYSRMGPMMDTVTRKPADYSSVDPTYRMVNGQKIRVSGVDNFAMKATTNYSYVPGANRGFVVQDPDSRVSNLYQRPDKNVNGGSTLTRAQADGGRFQQYRVMPKPQFSGRRETFNMESSDGTGMETRFIDAYNIQTQFNQPLNQVYNPTSKGTIPPYTPIASPMIIQPLR